MLNTKGDWATGYLLLFPVCMPIKCSWGWAAYFRVSDLSQRDGRLLVLFFFFFGMLCLFLFCFSKVLLLLFFHKWVKSNLLPIRGVKEKGRKTQQVHDTQQIELNTHTHTKKLLAKWNNVARYVIWILRLVTFWV